jgi:hypothetical protein
MGRCLVALISWAELYVTDPLPRLLPGSRLFGLRFLVDEAEPVQWKLPNGGDGESVYCFGRVSRSLRAVMVVCDDYLTQPLDLPELVSRGIDHADLACHVSV